MDDEDDEDEVQKKGLEEAKLDNIKLVFQKLQAMEAVKKEDIPKGFKAHNTHFFTAEKFTADGKHNKYKRRLVAHGNEQDTILHADRSSPTVSMQSNMTCLVMAACNSDSVVGKLDVKGAIIQTEMTGVPVYTQCRGKLKDPILKVLPELVTYVGSDGALQALLSHLASTVCVSLNGCPRLAV